MLPKCMNQNRYQEDIFILWRNTAHPVLRDEVILEKFNFAVNVVVINVLLIKKICLTPPTLSKDTCEEVNNEKSNWCTRKTGSTGL